MTVVAAFTTVSALGQPVTLILGRPAGTPVQGHEDLAGQPTTLARRRTVVGVLWRIAEIIHEADIDTERYDVPEAPGFDVTLRACPRSAQTNKPSTTPVPVFDGLREFSRRSTLLGREPACRHATAYLPARIADGSGGLGDGKPDQRGTAPSPAQTVRTRSMDHRTRLRVAHRG